MHRAQPKLKAGEERKYRNFIFVSGRKLSEPQPITRNEAREKMKELYNDETGIRECWY